MTIPTLTRRGLVLCGAALALTLACVPGAVASDHADPINLDRLEGGITDLFAFPTKKGARGVVDAADGDHLVLVLCVRRALTTSPPYPELDQYTYRICIDLKSRLSFEDKHDLARYGGTVPNPEGISAHVTFTLALDKNARFRPEATKVEGLSTTQGMEWYSGVRDDPFIFPQFFGTNVVAMVISVPFESFPRDQKDFLIWATSSRHGVPIDHVGRSQRTQLPRFDLLNTLHPKDHVAALRKKQQDPGLVDDFLRTRIIPVFALRPYDFQPDVMVFSRQKGRPARFPNGRQLEDDVAKLTAEQGDCQLLELSFSHPRSASFEGGRPTKNDKEFLNYFPYLAEPWPDSSPRTPPELTTKNRVLVWLIILAVAVAFLLPWILYFRVVLQLRAVPQATRPPLRHLQPAGPEL